MRSDTRVRFTKDIILEAYGNYPEQVFAKEGDVGTIEAALPGKVYLARTDNDPTWFAVAKDEIEFLN